VRESFTAPGEIGSFKIFRDDHADVIGSPLKRTFWILEKGHVVFCSTEEELRLSAALLTQELKECIERTNTV